MGSGRPLTALAALLLACILAGCASSPALPDGVVPSACPTALIDAAHLTVSVAQVPAPDGVSVPSGSVRLMAGVGRRLLLSLEVAPLPHVRLIENSLDITTLGGTLAGWARVDRPAGAGARESIQVSGGYLRLAPFLPGHTLRTHTQTIDVLVLPGGEPASQLAILPGRMWDEAGRPTQPGALEIRLDPIQHMTVLDVVDATAQLDLIAQHRSGAHEYWECSIQSDFQLVDHDAVLPRLWTLRRAQRGAPNDTVALYKPVMGAFPLVFLDPVTAGGFGRWLSETHAARVGGFDIGWVASKDPTGFRAATDPGASNLAIRQLGSE